jgi:hypothetical protein
MSPVIPPPPKPPDPPGKNLVANVTYPFRYVHYVHKLTVWNKKYGTKV